MSVCDTSRHQPTQQRNTVRLAWQRIVALQTLIHNMNYSHNPLGPVAIFISSTSSFNLSLFTHLCHFCFVFFYIFSPLSSLFCSFARLLSLSFPPLCSFSVDVWRALQHRGDGTGLTRGRGHRVGSGSGGEERALCLEDGRRVMCLNVGRGGPPIDRLRTRLAVLENYGSLSQEVKLESQVTH